MKKITSGLLSVLIGLLVLELLSRAVATFFHDAEHDKNLEGWFVYSPDLGWEPKPGYKGIVATTEREFDAQGYLSGDQQKISDSTKKRILFLGDSNTFGNDQPANKTFVALVDSMLQDAVTINLSAPGYTSYQGKIILARALQRFHPDVIVTSFNFNDRRYVLNGDEVDGPEGFRRTYELAKREEVIRTLEKFYAFRSLRFLLRSAGLLKKESAITEVRIDSLSVRVNPACYRKNLEDIAGLAKQNNIPLVFLLLKDNPLHTEYLRKGITTAAEGNLDLAIGQFTISMRQGTVFRMLSQLYLSQSLFQKGDVTNATAALTVTNPPRLLQGGFPMRLDTVYNDIMRDVGRRSQVEIVDGGKELDAYPWVYYDFCHFDTTGHRMVANLLAPIIRTKLKHQSP